MTLFGQQNESAAEPDPDLKRLQEWAKHGGKPDKALSLLIRNRLVETEQWRERLIAEIQRACEVLIAQQHSDALEVPVGRTAEYYAGRAQGRYEGFDAAKRILTDITNRAGLPPVDSGDA